MKIKSLICVAVATLLIFCFSGCNDTENRASTNYYYIMNTTAYLLMPESEQNENPESYQSLLSETNTILNQIDASLSTTRTDSKITKFNQSAAGERVEIDSISYDVLTIAKDVYESTNGYYNPAVYYSVAAYGFNGGSYPTSADSFPSDEVAAKYITLAESFGDIILEQVDGKFYATKPTTTVEVDGETLTLRLDLGGVGKGYATDKVLELFTKYNFNYGLFNFGLSSLGVKKYLSDTADVYTLSLINPRNSSGTYFSVKLKDTFVSTSGDYENYFQLDGKRYCHIINPKTGKPIENNIMSATVIGGTAAENDALTTAIMAMSIEDATNFISTLADRRVVFSFESEGYKFTTNIPDGDYVIQNSQFVKA